jgi:nicotinate-nucleotide adenylyltransferase
MLKKRVGIFGGTFDPIHNGHLIIAQCALTELGLDKILFIPAASPPHKKRQNFSPPEIRCRLVESAIAENKQFELSTIELERPGPSYMVDTLTELDAHPPFRAAELYLIIGADNFITFSQWREPGRILSLAKLAVYPRFDSAPDISNREILQNTIFFHAPRLEISSSHIRSFVRRGKSVKYLVPDGVEKCIEELKLYREPCT